MLSLRTRLIGVSIVVAIAGIGTVVLLPKLEQTITQMERIGHGQGGGLVRGLAQQLFTTPRTTTRPRAIRTGQRGRPRISAARPGLAGRPARQARAGSGGISLRLMLRLAEALLGLVLALALATVASRLVARRRRVVCLFELHQPGHDHGRPEDLLEMAGQLGRAIRVKPPWRRWWRGERSACLESIATPGEGGRRQRWGVRCDPRSVRDIEGALQVCFPDIRLGRGHGEPPRPLVEHATVPPHVLRLAKRKSFVLALFPLRWAQSKSGSSVQARLALAQAQRSHGSVVRLAITPAPRWAEGIARGAYRAREKLRGGRGDQLTLFSPLTGDELTSAEETQNQALFWLEAQVASASREDGWEIAAALAADRGPNELRVRGPAGWLTRRRFLRALPPFRRSLSSLVSAAEVAYLLEPPRGQAMRTVPADRLVLPRATATPRTPAGTRGPAGPRERAHLPSSRRTTVSGRRGG